MITSPVPGGIYRHADGRLLQMIAVHPVDGAALVCEELARDDGETAVYATCERDDLDWVRQMSSEEAAVVGPVWRVSSAVCADAQSAADGPRRLGAEAMSAGRLVDPMSESACRELLRVAIDYGALRAVARSLADGVLDGDCDVTALALRVQEVMGAD